MSGMTLLSELKIVKMSVTKHTFCNKKNLWLFYGRVGESERLINVFLPQNPPEFADFRLWEGDRGWGGGIEGRGGEKWGERRGEKRGEGGRERKHPRQGLLSFKPLKIRSLNYVICGGG